jgi:hypothetical protein
LHENGEDAEAYLKEEARLYVFEVILGKEMKNPTRPCHFNLLKEKIVKYLFLPLLHGILYL